MKAKKIQISRFIWKKFWAWKFKLLDENEEKNRLFASSLTFEKINATKSNQTSTVFEYLKKKSQLFTSKIIIHILFILLIFKTFEFSRPKSPKNFFIVIFKHFGETWLKAFLLESNFAFAMNKIKECLKRTSSRPKVCQILWCKNLFSVLFYFECSVVLDDVFGLALWRTCFFFLLFIDTFVVLKRWQMSLTHKHDCTQAFQHQ